MNLDELLKREYPFEEAETVEGVSPRSGNSDLDAILAVIRKINTSLELKDVLELVTDEAVRIANAERGFIMLVSSEGKLEFVIGRDAHGKSIPPENLQVSRTVLEDVFITGESLCIENALSDERFERRQSIMNLELRTIICSPLQTHDEKIGVIYVDSKFIQAVDREQILSLFEILAGQAAIAIRNARLYDNLKRTYEELKQAHEHIIQSERMAMKGELAAEVSHELKNLVGVVLLNLELMQRNAGKVSLNEINALIEKTIAGVRKIEGFSKSLLTRRGASSTLLPSSLNKVASDFVEFVKFLPKFKANDIRFYPGKDIPPVALDADQLHQVLLNLVNNSVEAKPSAAIVLTTEYNPSSEFVTLSVSDDGPGIDESIRDRLFQEKVTTKVDGHGYGLPICKHIIEAHGGTIAVRSKKGAGATFEITFPVLHTR